MGFLAPFLATMLSLIMISSDFHVESDIVFRPEKRYAAHD